ncbi:hypothetical protein HMH01_00430 [Halovulum dunhuangense]|uniref:UPF0102 protein HMH01_00430 n=1 Tax=Halovulum dunhuangense TaxID=1505036 RepID=A0A849L021_9RHOB|nr:hypothetical protein [Halovulum dunhuangense]
MSGSAAFHGGLAAEAAAEAIYAEKGAVTLARRARTPAGEIDLIVALGEEIVFIEVKARRSHAAAAASLSRRQQGRILAAAEAWLAATGRPALTPIRFDLVTLDATGQPQVLENALGF